MIIDENNYQEGNKAMASVLLLYYHLIKEGGITNDQTVYIDTDDFDGFRFLDVKVNEDQVSLEIDQELLREGAVIFILCDLDDLLSERDETFMDEIDTGRIIQACKKGLFSFMPEVEQIVAMLVEHGYKYDFERYSELLAQVYQKYVLGRIKKLICE